eukprot:431599-Rhodomonas_salina.1
MTCQAAPRIISAASPGGLGRRGGSHWHAADARPRHDHQCCREPEAAASPSLRSQARSPRQTRTRTRRRVTVPPTMIVITVKPPCRDWQSQETAFSVHFAPGLGMRFLASCVGVSMVRGGDQGV